jgi:hypothetical protein
MFSKKRKYKKSVNKIGPNIHKQIMDAVILNPSALTTPKHMTFAAGYLQAATISVLQEVGCNDPDTSNQMLKFLCEGVMPGRLWDVLNRAHALMDLEVEPQLLRAYNHGQRIGLVDRLMDGDMLTEYLVGNEVNYSEDAEISVQ